MLIRSLVKTPVIAKICIFALLLAQGTNAGELYRWTDKNGVTHFSDTRAPDAEQIRVKPINVYEAPTSRGSTGAAAKAAGQPQVIMYGTTWCGICQRARAYFRGNKIRYTEYDVENSSRGKKDYRRMKGKGVPIFLVDGKRVNGFNKSRFDSILGIDR